MAVLGGGVCLFVGLFAHTLEVVRGNVTSQGVNTAKEDVAMAELLLARRPLRVVHLIGLLTSIACVILSAPLVHAQGSGGSRPDLPPELERVRVALEKYQDPVVAVHDGYFSPLGCIEYPSGLMGVHFLNPRLIGPVPDPMQPQILLYEPVGDKLRLVGAEWFIPLATGVKERPSLIGQPLDGPMEGHEPLQPAGLHHYDLHVGLFMPNPAGLFSPANPVARCPQPGIRSRSNRPSRFLSPLGKRSGWGTPGG